MAYQMLNCPAVQGLLQAIENDFNLPNLSAKYLGTQSLSIGSETPTPAIVATLTPPPKKRKVVVDPCCGKTAKGDPCRFKVKSDGLCGIHLRQRDSPVVKKAVKADGVSTVPKVPKKVKKVVPTHTHVAEETGVECGLCETQGNVVVPELTEAEFEVVEEEGLSIQERLKAILAGAVDDEADQEEVPVEPETPLDSMSDLLACLPVSTVSEEEEEPEEEDDSYDVSLEVKLARLIADEDSDSDVEDDVVEQMSETPPSKAKLKAFEELLEEMEC